jgi:hypothetical protein
MSCYEKEFPLANNLYRGNYFNSYVWQQQRKTSSHIEPAKLSHFSSRACLKTDLREREREAAVDKNKKN